MSENKEQDEYNLKRFIDAQDWNASYATALEELLNGRKESHWIWYVFPQLAGLGTSAMCRMYAISCLDEAKAYLKNKILHDRLVSITSVVVKAVKENGISLTQLLGEIDAVKFRSSMTLFLAASDKPEDKIRFANALIATECDGMCAKTLDAIGINLHEIS